MIQASFFLESIIHSAEEIQSAAEKHNLTVVRCLSVEGSEELLKIDQRWLKHVGRPMIQLWQLELVDCE